MTADPGAVRARTVAFNAIVVALLTAAVAEYAIRTSANPRTGVALYLVAAALIATTSVRFRFPATEAGAQSLRPAGWLLLVAGAGGSLALAWHTFSLLRIDRAIPPPFRGGCFAAAAADCQLVVRWLNRPTTCGGPSLKRTQCTHLADRGGDSDPRCRRAYAFLCGWIASPLASTPTRAHRAAVAIQIVRNTTPSGIFEAGWYYISMLYFHLMALPSSGLALAMYRRVPLRRSLDWRASPFRSFGIRHFSWRVGILAGILAATTGVALQFSRLTTRRAPPPLSGCSVWR